MGMGIMVCGLNGAGKSTLGKTLADRLHFYFIDNEELYFPKTNPNYRYASPRSKEEVEDLLFEVIKTHENFVFAAVKGDYGERIYPYFRCVILIQVPKEVRVQRVRQRSFQKFGDRMMPGGDLYKQEEEFFAFVKSRDEDTVESWIKALDCPIIRVDGTLPIEENVEYIAGRLQEIR